MTLYFRGRKFQWYYIMVGIRKRLVNIPAGFNFPQIKQTTVNETSMACDHLQDLFRPQIHQCKFSLALFALLPKLVVVFLFLLWGRGGGEWGRGDRLHSNSVI